MAPYFILWKIFKCNFAKQLYLHAYIPPLTHTDTHKKKKRYTLRHSNTFGELSFYNSTCSRFAGWLIASCVCVCVLNAVLYKTPPFETIKTAKERQWVFNNKMFSNKILTCKHSVWKYWKHIWIDGPTTTSTPYLLIKLPKQISQFPSYNNCGSTESKNYVYYSGILLAFSCLFYWLYYANKKKAFVCLFAGTHPHSIRNCAFFPHD